MRKTTLHRTTSTSRVVFLFRLDLNSNYEVIYVLA